MWWDYHTTLLNTNTLTRRTYVAIPKRVLLRQEITLNFEEISHMLSLGYYVT